MSRKKQINIDIILVSDIRYRQGNYMKIGYIMEAKTVDTGNRVNIGKALKLKYFNGVSEADIAKTQGVCKQAINKALKPFQELFKDSQAIEFVSDNYRQTLSMVNSRLLLELVDAKKLKDASLNNTAYTMGVVSKELRLEQGKATDNTDVMINQINDIKSNAVNLIKQLRQDNPTNDK